MKMNIQYFAELPSNDTPEGTTALKAGTHGGDNGSYIDGVSATPKGEPEGGGEAGHSVTNTMVNGLTAEEYQQLLTQLRTANDGLTAERDKLQAQLKDAQSRYNAAFYGTPTDNQYAFTNQPKTYDPDRIVPRDLFTNPT